MKQSNYELTKRRMQGHFLDFDQNTMIRRFGLQHDAEYLYIRFVGRLYRIDRKTGRVQWSWDDFAMELTGASTRPCPFMTFCAAPRRDAGCLRIWDFLGFHCRGTGRGVVLSPGRRVPGRTRSSSVPARPRWCGGGEGDVAYCLPVFDCLPGFACPFGRLMRIFHHRCNFNGIGTPRTSSILRQPSM